MSLPLLCLCRPLWFLRNVWIRTQSACREQAGALATFSQPSLCILVVSDTAKWCGTVKISIETKKIHLPNFPKLSWLPFDNSTPSSRLFVRESSARVRRLSPFTAAAPSMRRGGGEPLRAGRRAAAPSPLTTREERRPRLPILRRTIFDVYYCTSTTNTDKDKTKRWRIC
jgi:hypothetical protein